MIEAERRKLTGDLDELLNEAGELESNARTAFVETMPTTRAGFEAMLHYAAELQGIDGHFFCAEEMTCLLCNLAEAYRETTA